MTSIDSNSLVANDPRGDGLTRPAVEKFVGAWLACFLVMARGNFAAAISLDHLLRASICGTVGAVVAVGLLAQMNRTTNSVARQATISAVIAFIGDVFAHPPYFQPQWADPLSTAVVAAGIAVALWYAKRWVKSL